MPLGPNELRIADELTRLYAETQARLTAELARAVQDPNRRSQVSRLREMIRTTTAIRRELEQGTRAWLTTSLAQVHQAGAVQAALSAGSSFAWTAPHVEAVQALASNTWTDVAANLQGLEADTKRAIRELTSDAAREVLLEGKSSAQVAGGIERWMGQNGIGTVTYRNGARHLAADYADTLARTVTANAYNEGTFTQLEGDDIEWVEVSDGPACGWSSHQDGDKANGTIRRLADARLHPISHPRCARSFSGRPDITTAQQAEAGRLFTPEEQARMAAEEEARDAASPITLTGRRRTGRTPRSPRTPRIARGQDSPADEARKAPVSAAVDVRARQAGPAASQALAAIDQVHDDGVLPTVPLRGSPGTGNYGVYRSPPPRIDVAADGDHVMLTTVHEVGHMLDHLAIPGPGLTSRSAAVPDNPMHAWFQAAQGSDAYGTLARSLDSDYLLDPAELWARSYAQYIATRSGDVDLAAELAGELARQAAAAPDRVVMRQWATDDFEPIAQAIDDLLAGLGWRP